MYNVIIIILNIFICVLNIIGFMRLTEPFTLYTFRYYTFCSNLLAIINAIIVGVFVYRYNKSRFTFPKGVYIFNYVITVSLMLTMIVVFFVLIPMYGKGGVKNYLTGDIRSLAFHLISPILSIIIFILIRKYNSLQVADIFIPFIPTVMYAIILLILNILKIVDGPYDFLKIYNQPIHMTIFWIFCILGDNLLISWVVYVISKIK